MTRDGGQRDNIQRGCTRGLYVCHSQPLASSRVASPCSYESSPLDDTRYVARANLAGLECTDPGSYASTRGTDQGAWLHSARRVD